MAYQSVYPYTGELKKTYENQSDEYVEDKLQKADARVPRMAQSTTRRPGRDPSRSCGQFDEASR